MTEEAREAEAWLRELVMFTPISTEAALIAYEHGRAAGIAEGQRQTRELADAIWAESQANEVIIRDAGIMQDIVLRIDTITGRADRFD